MNEKMFNTRIIHKHDTEVNWAKALNFIPKQGELIVYDVDENYNYERIKIGDGTTKINDLPFVTEPFEAAVLYEAQELTDEQKAQARENIGAGDFGGSWNDLTDKPFYEEEAVETALIENASGSWMRGERPIIDIDPAVALVGGTTYKIVIKSTLYGDTTTEVIEATAESNEFEVICLFSVQGCDWFLSYEIETNSTECGSWGGSYTATGSIDSLYVYEVTGGNIQCLDEKFIPDTIARVEDIPEVPVTSVNGQTGDVVVEQVQSDWSQTDDTQVDYIKNKPDIATDDEIIALLAQEDMLPVVTDSDGALLADENDNILLW